MILMDAAGFLKDIKPKDDVVIIFNNDADGICSCALVMQFLEEFIKLEKRPFIIPQPMPMDKNLMQRIQTTLPTKIVFVDLAADQTPSIVKKLGSICDILIIDHHQITQNLKSKVVIHYNPRFKKPNIYQSASYLTYKICSGITDMSAHLWIAAVGMIADYNLDDSSDLVEEIRKKYNIVDIKESIFSKIAEMISASRATREISNEEIVNILVGSKKPEDFEKANDKLIDSFMKIGNELVSIMLDSENSSEKIGRVVFYNIKSKYNIRSEIATRLSEKYPNKLVIVYELSGNRVKLSARNQKDIDVGKCLEKATEKMKASAGGHDKAAGASIETKDWEEFREKLIALLG